MFCPRDFFEFVRRIPARLLRVVIGSTTANYGAIQMVTRGSLAAACLVPVLSVSDHHDEFGAILTDTCVFRGNPCLNELVSFCCAILMYARIVCGRACILPCFPY